MKIRDIEDVTRLAQERIKLAEIYDELRSPSVTGLDYARVKEMQVFRSNSQNLSISALTQGTQILSHAVERALTDAVAQLVADRVVTIDLELAALGVEVEDAA